MKRIIGSILCLFCLLSLTACGSAEDAVTVQPVSMITGGSTGMVDRCAGKVVSGQTAKVEKDAKKTVLEVYVQEGDMVDEGTVLFAYDAAAMKLDLEKLQLELQGLENTISSATSEIEELERQKASVAVANQLSYTIQIDAKRADIREAEYNKALKQREIENMEAALEATDVTAPISGRVMSINQGDDGGNGYGDDGSSSAFITIMDMSNYRVQGNINELNLYSLTVGMPVIVRSRMDESVTWKGTVESIDWDNPATSSDDGNRYYYIGSGSDEMTSSSKYPFYVSLDSVAGLILGQHVYVEPDYGQDGEKDGIWLPSYYICSPDSSPYVWAASSRDKLEKRSVVLGEYDEALDQYLVTSGISRTDYLAFPDDSLRAGQIVSRYSSDSFASGGDAGFASGGDAFGGEEMPEYEPAEDAALPEGADIAPEEDLPAETLPEDAPADSAESGAEG